MASGLDLVGVEAVILGLAAFRASAAAINSDLAAMGASTAKLEAQSIASFGAISGAGEAALGAVAGFAIGAGVALAAVTGAVVEIGASFENNLRRANIAADATSASLSTLRQTVLSVGKDTPVALDDVARAAAQLTQEGVSLDAINNGLLQSTVNLNVATGENGGLADAARVTALAIQAWGLSERDASGVTDVLAAIVNNTTAKLGGLYTTLAQIAPQAAALHIPIQDLGAALGELAAGGVTSSSAGYALNQVFARLLNPTKENLSLMKQYGVSLQDAAGNTIGLRELIGRLNSAFSDEQVSLGKLTQAQRDQAVVQLFGQRGLKDALVLIDQGTAGFDKFAKIIAGTDVNALAEQINTGLVPQLGILRNNLEALAVEASGPINNALGGLLVGVNTLLKGLDPNVPRAFGAALAAVFSGGAASGSNIGQFFGSFSVGAQKAISDVVSVLLALRVAIVNGVVPAVESLFNAIVSRVGSVVDFQAAVDGLVNVILTVAAAVTTFVDNLASFVRSVQLSDTATRILREALVGVLALPLIGLVSVFIGIASAVGGIVAPALLVVGAIVGIQEAARNVGILAGVFSVIRGAVEDVLPVISNIGTRILAVGIVVVDVIKNVVIPSFQSMADTLSKLFSGSDGGGGPGKVFTDLLSVLVVIVGFIPSVVERFANLAEGFSKTAAAARVAHTEIGGLADTIDGRLPVATVHATGLSDSLIKLAQYAFLFGSSFTQVGAQIVIVEGVFRGLKPVFDDFGATLNALVRQQIFGFSLLGNAIVDAFLPGFRILLSALPPVVDAIIGSLSSIAKAIETTARAFGINIPDATSALDTLDTTLQGVRDTASKAFADAGTSLNKFADGFKTSSQDAANGALAALQAAGEGFIDFERKSNATFFSAIGDIAAWEGEVDTAVPAVGGRVSGLADLTVTKFAGMGAAYAQSQTTTDNWRTIVDNALREVENEFALLGGASGIAASTVGRNMGLMDLSVSEHASNIEQTLANLRAAFAAEQAAANAVAPGLSGPGLARPGEPGPIDRGPFPPPGPPPGPPPPPGFPDLLGGGAGPKAAKQTMTELVRLIEQLIKDIPGAGVELAKFLAQLETTDPGRLSAMVDFLHEQKSTIQDMVVATGQLLATENQIAAVNADIASLTAQQEQATLNRDAAEIGLQTQLDQLSVQRLAIQQQIAPIDAQIRDIDAQITQLQATNLGYQRQQLELQLQMLPLQNQIADVAAAITAAGRENFALQSRLAVLALAELGPKQAIAALEQQITDSVDQRQALQQDIASAQANIAVRNVQSQLDTVTQNLSDAWKTLNVPAILAAEAQQRVLQAQLTTAQRQQQIAQNAAGATQDQTRIVQDQIKLQEQAFIDVLKPLQARVTLLTNQQDLEKANQAIVIANLNAQKQALEDTLKPLADQLEAVRRLAEQQKLQVDIAVNGLNAQKAALEALRQPLLDQLQRINDQSAAIQLQIDVINAQSKVEQDQITAKLLNDKLTLASLKVVEGEEADRFKAIVTGYLNAAVKSGAFTASEAAETIKRLTFIDSQIAKWVEDASQIKQVQDTVASLHRELDLLPKDVTVTIHVNTVGVTGGAPPPGGASRTSTVGVPFISGTQTTPTTVTAASSRAIGGFSGGTGGNTTTYQVNATYNQPQDVGSVGLDLRALVAMSKK